MLWRCSRGKFCSVRTTTENSQWYLQVFGAAPSSVQIYIFLFCFVLHKEEVLTLNFFVNAVHFQMSESFWEQNQVKVEILPNILLLKQHQFDSFALRCLQSYQKCWCVKKSALFQLLFAFSTPPPLLLQLIGFKSRIYACKYTQPTPKSTWDKEHEECSCWQPS